jgi:hypothetical protein
VVIMGAARILPADSPIIVTVGERMIGPFPK